MEIIKLKSNYGGYEDDIDDESRLVIAGVRHSLLKLV